MGIIDDRDIMGFKEINGDLHAGARVIGGRVQNLDIPPGHPIAGKSADVIKRISHIDAVNILAHAGVDGSGNRVGKVGDAEKVQEVKPESVQRVEEVVRLGFNVRTKKPRTSRFRYISIAAFS